MNTRLLSVALLTVITIVCGPALSLVGAETTNGPVFQATKEPAKAADARTPVPANPPPATPPASPPPASENGSPGRVTPQPRPTTFVPNVKLSPEDVKHLKQFLQQLIADTAEQGKSQVTKDPNTQPKLVPTEP